MNIYYRVVTVWCKYPFNSVIDERYCEFSFASKKWKTIDGLKINSNTTIEEKQEYLLKETGIKYNIQKIK